MKMFSKIKNLFRKKEQAGLCPNCKTGAYLYVLDKREPLCPYMEYYRGLGCAFYKPLLNENIDFDTKTAMGKREYIRPLVMCHKNAVSSGFEDEKSYSEQLKALPRVREGGGLSNLNICV